MSGPLETLLARRLLLVTGKGGTGKTTIAAALALLAARRGLETVIIEIGDSGALPPLLFDKPDALPSGNHRQPVPVCPHLYTLEVDPLESLREYLELQFRVGRVVGLVTRNAGFRRLLEVAPGWRELITLGKLWHLESQVQGDRPRWDLLVVDAPATGHGLSFLSVPRVVIETVRMGPLRRHTDRVHALLTDPERTLVLPVTHLEELPVRETLELCEGLRGLGLSTGPIVANAIEPEPEVQEPHEVLRWLERVPVNETPPGLPPEVLGRCLDHAVRRASLQNLFLRELRDHESGPVIGVPFLPRGVQQPEDLRLVSEALEAALEQPGDQP